MAIPIFADLHLIKKRDALLKQNGNHNKSPPAIAENEITQDPEQRLQSLVISSQNILIKVDTVWPIDFFSGYPHYRSTETNLHT